MFFDPVLPDGTVIRQDLPRSVVAFAALALGFVVAKELGGIPSAAGFGLSAGLCAVAALSRGRVCKAALVVAVVSLGAAWFSGRLIEPGPGSLAAMLPEGESIVTVEGVVLDAPRRVEAGPDPMRPPIPGASWRARVRVDDIHGEHGVVPAAGRVWVRAGGGGGSAGAGSTGFPRAGDHVRLMGVFEAVGPPLNPGEPNRRLWGMQEGYVGWLRAGTLEGTVVPGGGRSTLLAARAWLAARARMLLLGEDAETEVPDGRAEPRDDRDGRALLAALILGEEEPALRESRGAFNRLGLAHVLSISGFHIAVMTMVGLLLLRVVGDLGWVEPALTAGLLLVYLAVLPFNAPVWRSGLMVVALLAGDALGRRYDRLALLGWIATALALWRPMDVWSMGFQLSFGLVAVLIRFGTPFHMRVWGMRLRGPRPEEPTLARAAVEGVKRLVSTNILCWLAATPLVMYHTGLFSPVAVLTGVVVVPLISAVLILGYATVLLGVMAPPLTPLAVTVITALAAWTSALVRWIDGAAWTSAHGPVVGLAWAAVATAAVLYCVAQGDRRDFKSWAAAAVLASWFAAEAWFRPAVRRDVAVRIDALAVGDGTCQLVRSGRSALLWDCGSLTPGVGRMLVPRAVRALGVSRVPTVVITHPNLDHFNGVLDVAEPLGVREVLVGEAFGAHAARHPRSAEAFLLAELSRRGIRVRTIAAGTRVGLDGAVVEFMWPAPGSEFARDNDMSLVAKVSGDGGAKGNAYALLCGDIQDEAITGLTRAGPLYPTVLEAPHHGSFRESAFAFVAGTGAPVVLQSTGPSRASDGRWAAVRAGRTWLCTARDGASWAEILRDGRVRAGAFRRPTSGPARP